MEILSFDFEKKKHLKFFLDEGHSVQLFLPVRIKLITPWNHIVLYICCVQMFQIPVEFSS